MATVKIFISYAKTDYNLMTAVEFCCKEIGHITFQDKKYKIDVWSDHHLLAGDAWKAVITERIKEADVILFLVSPNFVKSEFIINTEIPLALKRKEEAGIEILGIFMDECTFSHLPIKRIQLVPSIHGRLKPVVSWHKNKLCWDAIRNGVEICAFRSINQMPWNKGITQKLPDKLKDKSFVHNAPPELQHLRNMVVQAEIAKKRNAAKKKKDEEDARNTALVQFAFIVIALFFFYTIISKYL